MCATCGCSPTHDHVHDHDHDHDHDHEHSHDHSHGHDHPPGTTTESRRIRLETELLGKNRELAQKNRGWLIGRGILALNLLSSPGSGKTTLLERTLAALGREVPIAVIEGDQATDRDAARIRAAGGKAVQINTGTGCHLDAAMVAGGLKALDPPAGSIVMIENVGNLVCPALFDLGEAARVVIASPTEGEDKPLKYPHMFQGADLVVLNKVDLLPHLEFDRAAFDQHLHAVKPGVRVLALSARTGAGLDAWLSWLSAQRAEARARTL